MNIGRVWIHRSEQFDLWQAITRPLVVVHVRRQDGRASRRVFCVWRPGIQIGSRYFRAACSLSGSGAPRTPENDRP